MGPCGSIKCKIKKGMTVPKWSVNPVLPAPAWGLWAVWSSLCPQGGWWCTLYQRKPVVKKS